jgi:hypothetical protein
VPDVAGVYRVSLVVSDGVYDSEPDEIEISATEDNGAPVANAGADQAVTAGDTVMVDASASSDPDGDPLSYLWSLSTRPTGSASSLSSTSTARPSFTTDKAGVYECTLTVSDGSTTSAPDKVRVVAESTSGGSGGGGSGCGCSDGSAGGSLLALGVTALYFRRKQGLRPRPR